MKLIAILLASVLIAGQESRPLNILHFSDLHGSKKNLERIVEYKSAHPEVDDAIHTGDGVACYFDDENVFATVKGADGILNVIGNHDCWKGHLVWSQTDKPYDAEKGDVFGRFLVGPDPSAPFISRWGVVRPEGAEDPQSPDFEACYYYKDYPQSSARLVVLDCVHYDSAQHGWFVRTLSDAREKGYAVICATHYPSESGLEPYESRLTPSGEDFPQSYNPGAVQTESMAEKVFFTVDDFIDAGGLFVCWLSGHDHNDYVGRVKGHTRQIQILVDKAGELDSYMFDSDRSGSNADAFNIVTFDPEKKMLTVRRVGCAEGFHGAASFVVPLK